MRSLVIDDVAGAPFDPICVDIGLPDMDGLELLRPIRALGSDHGRTGRTAAKVLMVTASDSGQDVMQAFRDQADAYLRKPFTKKDLEAQLRRLELLGEVA